MGKNYFTTIINFFNGNILHMVMELWFKLGRIGNIFELTAVQEFSDKLRCSGIIILLFIYFYLLLLLDSHWTPIVNDVTNFTQAFGRLCN